VGAGLRTANGGLRLGRPLDLNGPFTALMQTDSTDIRRAILLLLHCAGLPLALSWQIAPIFTAQVATPHVSVERKWPGSAGVPPAASTVYGSPVHLADLEYQAVTESSGIAASRRNPGLLWTHNDSGDRPLIYAFDRRGKHRGVWQVLGAKAEDWEDMAIGPGPNSGVSYLYVGDIGDNSRKREEIVVYRVVEPLISSTDSSSSKRSPRMTEPSDAIRMKYPDGRHNAETLLVHPSTGDLYIVTKVPGEAAGIYKAKAPLSKSRITTLDRVGELRFPNALGGVITGGSISPDGRRVILCDYIEAFELVVSDRAGFTFDTIWRQPLVSVNIGARQQGEAVCYRADGLALFATSEQLPCPLIEIKRIERQTAK
jgi:hypothetical protein